MIESESKIARSEVTDDHISLVLEHIRKYNSHFLLSSGLANNIVNGHQNFCIQKKIDIDKVNSLECDGTNTNIGWKEGVKK